MRLGLAVFLISETEGEGYWPQVQSGWTAKHAFANAEKATASDRIHVVTLP